MRRRFEPLRVRPFGRLLGSYTVNDLGDSIGVVALSVLVFDRTGDVAPTAGFFLVAKFLPALFSTGLTAHLDRFSLRRVLPTIYGIEALVFAALAFLAIGDRFFLPLVLALGLIDGTLAITGRGLTRGAVAAALQPHGLIAEGNALMNLGFAAASVFGAAIAGGLIAAFGLSAALFVDAASFLIIAVWLATARDLPQIEHHDYEPWHRRFRDGMAFARSQRTIRTLLLGQSLALICFTIVVPIEVIYAKESLGTTDAGFGVLLSSWGAGIVLGSLLYIAVKNRSSFGLIVFSSALVGLAYLGMSQAGTLWLACVMSVIGGAGNGIQWVAVMTALQEVTPTEFQARMSGLLESIGAAMPGIGFLLGGLLTALGSPRTAFAFAGAGILALVILALLLRPRLERRAAQTSTTTGKTMGRRLSRS
ncbi:MFS transporter [Solirubrobacter sp. CPCC 204708]|uniref:MFS transporter n=1 Tax=Solirubrobacter deserti TaxID=2282478 RepID=A0ABT4RH03_9ACTN|nr:MFS transporter [Solirubrobacter deserti]MBE2315343.1 MFS transporter [Solirubrobacter deserti]MDA0137812.1 MFS transporter [Solirubrobacter deserti]